MPKDFFDDDLADVGGGEDAPVEAPALLPNPVSDVNLSRMVRQKNELGEQVAGATREIEQLRWRQGELDRERKRLEELARKQVDYEKGKQDVIERLSRNLIRLQKEEAEATRAVEVLSVMRERFKESLAEMQAIDEDGWAEPEFAAELDKALVRVENAGNVLNKGLAKVEAEGWHKPIGRAKARLLPDELPHEPVSRLGFGFWLKVGIAVSLPLAVVMIALFVGWLVMTGII